MLIFDIPASNQTGATLRIASVGTCRVHNPLRALADAGLAKLVWGRFNAFVHSPAEVLQQLLFVSGQINLPNPFAPYIFRDYAIPVRDQALSEALSKVDIFVVEISDYRSLRCGEYLFQQNYFSETFVRFHGLPAMDWWRAVCVPGRDRSKADRDFLAHLASGRAASPAQEEVIRCADFQGADAAQLTAQVEQIRGFAPDKRWVFVPHFDIEDEKGRPIPVRTTLRQMLAQAQQDLGLETADFTPLIRSAGRKTALASEGKDIHHFAKEFEQVAGTFIVDALMSTL